MKLCYFDNAATSFPKPPQVLKAMENFTNEIGANPGRSGHRLSIRAGRIVEEVREKIAQLFNVADPLRITFTHNATYALNLALRGILKDGDHVITTSLEHNSVARPLRDLEKKGIKLTILPADPKTCQIDLDKLNKAFKKNTKMVVTLHGSNVTGRLLPLKEIGALAREKGVLYLVDAAQTAGCVPIDVFKMNIDLLAFTGHKALFGPQGTGGLYVRPGLQVASLIQGGTGSRSEEDRHPKFFPDALEAGTLNTVGLAGLNAGVAFVLKTGVKKIRKKETKLLKKLLEGLESIAGVTIYGSPQPSTNIPVLSFTIKGYEPSEVCDLLDHRYQIMSRVGLHCSPWVHQTLGTYPHGTVRFSLSYFNTEDQVEQALQAVEEISNKKASKWASM
jgi:cysteine desulfurase family protein